MPYALPIIVRDDDLDEVRDIASRYKATVHTDQIADADHNVKVVVKAKDRKPLVWVAFDYIGDVGLAESMLVPNIHYTNA